MDAVIQALDASSIYKVPLLLQEEWIDELIVRMLNLKSTSKRLRHWEEKVVSRVTNPKEDVHIALVGKYISLQDAYKSVYESLIHGGIENNCRVIVKKIDSTNGISVSDLQNYDLVIWSGESNPLRSPLISNTPRALLEFFESGHGVILISDDATWDSTYDESSDPKSSSEITRSLTQVTTVDTGLSRTTQTIISTFEGDSHPIMNGILRINISSEKNYSNDIDNSLPGINAQVLATNIYLILIFF